MTSAIFQCLVLIAAVLVGLVVFWRLTGRAAVVEEESAPVPRPAEPAMGKIEVGGAPEAPVSPETTALRPDDAREAPNPPITTLAPDDPLAAGLTKAIQTGDLVALHGLLAEHPGLVTARIGPRTPLHIATDWPGHFPSCPATVITLLAAGADVNAHFSGRHTETPLHWAASSDDVEVLDVLIDAGADIEASGSVIDGGSPLADAVAFAEWRAARRLIERGAKTTLWQASALGLMDRVESYFVGGTPRPEDVTNAFWCACHGGQRESAEYLLAHGAELNWVGHDGLTALDAAARSNANDLVPWLRQHGARSASAAS